MNTIGIKELQVNPATLTKSLEKEEYTIITKRSNPIGIAVSLNDDVISKGLKSALLIEAFRNGLVSLGQVAKAMDISKEKAMRVLSLEGVDVIDYDFSDDLEFLNDNK